MPPQVATLFEKIAGGLLLKPLSIRYEKFLKDRRTRTELEQTWSVVHDKVIAENPKFDALVHQDRLMSTVLEHALDPEWLQHPDEGELWNTASLGWIQSDLSRDAVKRFFDYFVDAWRRTASFESQAALFEEIEQTDVLRSIQSALVVAFGQGVSIKAAHLPGPSQALLLEYCKRLKDRLLDAFPYERMVTAVPPPKSPPAAPIPFAEALDRHDKLLLLGEGGLGKTMALRCREWDLARRYAGGESVSIPVFLRLATYGGETIERLVADRINTTLKGSPYHLAETDDESERSVRAWLAIERGTIEILLDGLNEVPENLAAKFRSELESFIRYPQSFVLASRDSWLDWFSRYNLNPIEPGAVIEIVERRAPDVGVQLPSRMDADPGFAALLQNPFFLDVVLRLSAMSSGGNLPENRALLLRRYVASVPKAILGERQPGKAASRSGVVEAFLKALGYGMLRAGLLSASYFDVESHAQTWNLPVTNTMTLDDLLLGSSEFRHLRSAGIDGEPIEFRHQILRDYFAAERIAAEFQKGRDLDSATESQYPDPAWNDPVRMAIGLLGPGSAAVVQWLVARGSAGSSIDLLNLAFDCWRDAEARNDPAVTPLLAAALRAYIQPKGGPDLLEYADSVIEQLGELRDAASVPLIREFMNKVGAGWAHYEGIPALEKIGTREACDALVEYLGSRDENTTKASEAALRHLGAPAVASLLRSHTGSVENILREIAPAAVSELVRALGDSDRAVRRLAVYALGSSRSPEAVQYLIALLGRDDEDGVRKEAAASLGKLGDPNATSVLVSAIENEDENPGVILEAAYALWQHGWAADQARAVLFRTYEEPRRDESEKSQILNCLLLHPDNGIVVDLLFEASRSPSKTIRRNAFSRLGELPPNVASERVDGLLLESMRSPRKDVAAAAAYALYDRYKQDALPRLMMAFDEDPVHRLGILDTVGRYYGEAGRAWLANIAASA
ncbi:MAG TPA: HEAT repeat domain-containing protein, partial [Bryobacteraceae bacterium]|nr:HEAT repeat domain-containing protein [Bryobacteraceae bacterium]